jgi:hypothetical protein
MITRVAGSALRLERLDELFGEKQQGESGRVVLLDRKRRLSRPVRPAF